MTDHSSNGRGNRHAVLVISSHVVRGSVGNRAAVFALETLGHPVWAMPTVILPWHPGHGPSTRSVIPQADFSAMIDDLCRAPWLGEIGAVLTGYLGRAEQAEAIVRVIDAVRDKNPDALVVCDPVIGDHGGLYVPEETAIAIRDQLIPRASITTPNWFEFQWLSGTEIDSNTDAMKIAQRLAPPRVLVTSAVPMMAEATGNLLITASNAIMAEHQIVDSPPNGQGDLTAAVFLARLMNGDREDEALQKSTATVFEILARTAKSGADELTLESNTASLIRPMASVHMRQLLNPANKVREL